MLIKLLTKVFGSRNDRTLRRMRKVVNIINAMEPEIEKLSDEELKGKTAEFRARLEKGEVLENLKARRKASVLALNASANNNKPLLHFINSATRGV